MISPVQFIADCRLPIANFWIVVAEKSAIGNRQLAMS
jgi:hypothetical protein